MTKSHPQTSRPKHPAGTLAPNQAAGPKEIAFSVRLTSEEHEILRQAAAARGWTPTNLIRSATLERAKHILNTSQVTTFNFKGLAVRIADQLFKPKTYDVKLAYDDSTSTVRKTAAQLQNLGPTQDDESVVTSVTPNIEEFPIEVLAELKLAVRYGGGEFLNQILEYCEGLTAARRSDLPSPIDPLSP
jgi:uncharacterized protein (DUF1778 family)